MNQLNKLIQQYETENPGEKAYHERIIVGGSVKVWHEEFVEWQANQIEALASRPTCGKEQRKFLDEVEKLESSVWGLLKYKDTIAVNKDVFQSDLDKVIQGE